jgi:thiamine-phosphate pyrophosphorylase
MVISRDRPLLCFVHSTQGDRVDGERAARELAGVGGEAWAAVDIVQVRGKDLPAGDLEALTRVWIETLGDPRASKGHRSPMVVVNDRLDVALAAGADGVHLGQDDLPAAEARALAPPGFVIGVSAHGRAELERAQASGADYAGLGAFHPSGTKPGAAILDPEELGAMPRGLTIPVVAIGGITASRVADVLARPAVTGVAVGAAIQAAPEPAEAIRALRSALDRAWRERPPEEPGEGS